jgi:esterase/lipase
MPTSKSAQAAKSAKSVKPAKSAKTAKAPKEGGNIMQDIQKLAIPFAILAAKKGLDVAVEKTNQKKATASKTVAKTGGSKKMMVRGEMDKLSNEIEKYLNKY